MDFEKFGGRRYLLVWAVFIACDVLLWFSKLTPDVWQFVVVSIVGTYVAGNVAQRIAAKPEQEKAP